MKFFNMSLLFLTIICQNAFAQYFYTQKIRTDKKSFYKIKENGDVSDLSTDSYPINLKRKNYNSEDTIAMIRELLKYEGDLRICTVTIKNYNPSTSQIYLGKIQRYSLQLEALFIINQLYFIEPFKYSPFPVLYDKEKKTYNIINETGIKQAYYQYKRWFEKINLIGINEGRKKKIEPLSGGSISWFR